MPAYNQAGKQIICKARVQVAAGEPCAAQLDPPFDEPSGDNSQRTERIEARRASALHALGESYRDGQGGC